MSIGPSSENVTRSPRDAGRPHGAHPTRPTRHSPPLDVRITIRVVRGEEGTQAQVLEVAPSAAIADQSSAPPLRTADQNPVRAWIDNTQDAQILGNTAAQAAPAPAQDHPNGEAGVTASASLPEVPPHAARTMWTAGHNPLPRPPLDPSMHPSNSRLHHRRTPNSSRRPELVVRPEPDHRMPTPPPGVVTVGADAVNAQCRQANTADASANAQAGPSANGSAQAVHGVQTVPQLQRSDAQTQTSPQAAAQRTSPPRPVRSHQQQVGPSSAQEPARPSPPIQQPVQQRTQEVPVIVQHAGNQQPTVTIFPQVPVDHGICRHCFLPQCHYRTCPVIAASEPLFVPRPRGGLPRDSQQDSRAQEQSSSGVGPRQPDPGHSSSRRNRDYSPPWPNLPRDDQEPPQTSTWIRGRQTPYPRDPPEPSAGQAPPAQPPQTHSQTHAARQQPVNHQSQLPAQSQQNTQPSQLPQQTQVAETVQPPVPPRGVPRQSQSPPRASHAQRPSAEPFLPAAPASRQAPSAPLVLPQQPQPSARPPVWYDGPVIPDILPGSRTPFPNPPPDPAPRWVIPPAVANRGYPWRNPYNWSLGQGYPMAQQAGYPLNGPQPGYYPAARHPPAGTLDSFREYPHVLPHQYPNPGQSNGRGRTPGLTSLRHPEGVPRVELLTNAPQDARNYFLPVQYADAAAAARMSGFTIAAQAGPDYRPPQLSHSAMRLPLIQMEWAMDRFGNTAPHRYIANLPTPSSRHSSQPSMHAVPVNWYTEISYSGPKPTGYVMFNPYRPDVPMLKWDVRTPPELARRVLPDQTLVKPGRALDEPLTEPATHEVQIVYGTAMPGMENVFGPIHIRKPPGRAVTVGDMLRAVYEFFQTPLRQDEADALKARYPDMWRAWGEAFRTRCREAPHIAVLQSEWNRGMRRVDTLGERVKYWGLWTTHNASNNTWQLNLGLTEAPSLAPFLRGW